MIFRKVVGQIKKVAITGFIGYRNIGDDALLDATIRMLMARDIKNSAITVFTNGYCSPTVDHCVETAPELPGSVKEVLKNCFKAEHKKIYSTLFHSQVIVVAGGTVLAGTNKRTLHLWFFRVLLAKLFNCRIIFLGVGTGNLTRRYSKFFVKLILSLVDICTVRELQGYELLKKIAPSANIYISADLVFSLPLPEPDEFLKMSQYFIKSNNTEKIVGICVPYFSPAEGSTQKSMLDAAENFRQSIAEFADFIQTSCSGRVVFIPFQYPQDEQEAMKITTKMNTKASILPTHELSISQMQSLFIQLDYALVMRFHSVVFSAMANIPFIAIEYSQKVSYLVNDLDLNLYSEPYYFWQEATCSITSKMLVKKYQLMHQNENEIRSKLINRLKKLDQLQSVNQEALQFIDE